jgi:hypothetical protein
MSKINVCVLAVHLSGDDHVSKVPVSEALAGKYPVIPLRLFFKGGIKVHIDRVTDIRRKASLKAGGIGLRYTCLATVEDRQREMYIYKDEDTWFLEEEI